MMDDILILATTRWKLRKAILALNQTFDGLKLAKHPDKTAMGRVERGFDFLGYHFKPQGISLATQTLANFASKALWLYEQEPPHLRVRRLGEYLRRWQGWVVSGGVAGVTGPCLLSNLTVARPLPTGAAPRGQSPVGITVPRYWPIEHNWPRTSGRR
jgi:hypothetical protein